jgi:hypothetical protein
VDTLRNTTAPRVSNLGIQASTTSHNRVADVNPIGGISKTDLKRFIAYAKDAFDLPILTRSVASFQ